MSLNSVSHAQVASLYRKMRYAVAVVVLVLTNNSCLWAQYRPTLPMNPNVKRPVAPTPTRSPQEVAKNRLEVKAQWLEVEQASINKNWEWKASEDRYFFPGRVWGNNPNELWYFNELSQNRQTPANLVRWNRMCEFAKSFRARQSVLDRELSRYKNDKKDYEREYEGIKSSVKQYSDGRVTYDENATGPLRIVGGIVVPSKAGAK